MLGSIVLYHDAADAPAEAAIVVGINPAWTDDETGETTAESVNLLVLPDRDGPTEAEAAAALREAAGIGDDGAPQGEIASAALVSVGWLPYRAAGVPRDQPGKATGAYWSPIGG